MWPRKKSHYSDLKSILSKKLEDATVVYETAEWKRTCEIAVGGLRAVGFFEGAEDPKLDKLLAIGSRGQTIIDCLSGKVTYRNRQEDGYDPQNLIAWDLSGQNAEPVRMSGVDGGGLNKATLDGWSVECLPINWPIHHYVLQHPGGSLLSDHKLGRESRFDLIDFDLESLVWGFSNSGNNLLQTRFGDVILWSRRNASR
ncbi:MAG: hypothetical protein ACPGSI_11305 [Pikeienuella sp.]